MEALTVDTVPPVAADHDPVRCLLAIELSKEELDRGDRHGTVRQDQPVHLGWV
jgi:hypothetical protein